MDDVFGKVNEYNISTKEDYMFWRAYKNKSMMRYLDSSNILLIYRNKDLKKLMKLKKDYISLYYIGKLWLKLYGKLIYLLEAAELGNCRALNAIYKHTKIEKYRIKSIKAGFYKNLKYGEVPLKLIKKLIKNDKENGTLYYYISTNKNKRINGAEFKNLAYKYNSVEIKSKIIKMQVDSGIKFYYNDTVNLKTGYYLTLMCIHMKNIKLYFSRLLCLIDLGLDYKTKYFNVIDLKLLKKVENKEDLKKNKESILGLKIYMYLKYGLKGLLILKKINTAFVRIFYF